MKKIILIIFCSVFIKNHAKAQDNDLQKIVYKIEFQTTDPESKRGSASGFFISHLNSYFFITAKHVFFDKQGKNSCCKSLIAYNLTNSFPSKNFGNIDSSNIYISKNTSLDIDIASIKIEEMQLSTVEILPFELIKTIKKGDTIYIPYFTPELSSPKVLITEIASDPVNKTSEKLETKLYTKSATAPGASGAPVLININNKLYVFAVVSGRCIEPPCINQGVITILDTILY